MLKQFVTLTVFVFLIGCFSGSNGRHTEVDEHLVNVERKKGLTYVEGHLFTGELNLKNSNGDVVFSRFFKEGKLDGPYRKWYGPNQIKESRNFVNNKKEGKHLGYRSDGKLFFEFNFKDGKYTDTLKEWYSNGHLNKLEYYEDGKQVGRQKAWRKNGELYLNYDVRNGRKYGNAGIKHCKSLWNEVDTDM